MKDLASLIPWVMTTSLIATALIACADMAYCKLRKLPSDPKVSPAFRPAFKFFGIAFLISLAAMLLLGMITEGCSGGARYRYY